MTNPEVSANNLIVQLNKDVEKIGKPELSNEKQVLLLSELLTDRYLQAETIKMLEEIASKSQNPASWVNLGKLYVSIGSNELAENTYAKAIKLAKAAQEPVEQILAKAGLARVLNLQGKKQEAELLLEEVQAEVNSLKAKDRQKASSSCDPTCTQQNNKCGACCREGRVGKCVLIDGTTWIICRTAVC